MTVKGARLARDPLFPVLKDMIIQRTGLAYWSDKDDPLADIVAHVLEARALSAEDLVARLAAEGGSGPETQSLIDAVTVGETFFFRYREQFDALGRVVLPQVIARNLAHRTLSIWSAGCSNGAEPYSLAILLRRMFGPQLANWRVDILGTDISRAALAEAQAGEYGPWTVRDLPEDVRRECFLRHGNRWRVRPAYRQGVRFARHNLVKDPPPGRFDVVLCRNVLMYFDGATRERILAEFSAVLADGGWLLVGHAEVGPQIADHFDPVVLPTCTLYRKVTAGKRSPASPVGAAPRSSPALPEALPEARPELQARALLDRGDHTRAVALCRSWAQAEPMDPAPHYFLGLALEPLAEDQAIAAFRRALFLAPHLAIVHFHLLRLFRRRGDHVQADRHYHAVMADLSALPGDQPVGFGTNVSAGELMAISRRLGGPR